MQEIEENKNQTGTKIIDKFKRLKQSAIKSHFTAELQLLFLFYFDVRFFTTMSHRTLQ